MTTATIPAFCGTTLKGGLAALALTTVSAPPLAAATIISNTVFVAGSDADFGAAPSSPDPANIELGGVGPVLGGATELRFTETVEVDANRGVQTSGFLPAISVNGGKTATLSGGISGQGSLDKRGDGTLVINGTAAHDSGTRVSEGTLGGGTEYNGIASAIDVRSGATLAPGLGSGAGDSNVIRIDPRQEVGNALEMRDGSTFNVLLEPASFMGQDFLISGGVFGNSFGDFSIGVIEFRIEKKTAFNGFDFGPQTFDIMGSANSLDMLTPFDAAGSRLELNLTGPDGAASLLDDPVNFPVGQDLYLTAFGFEAGDSFVLRRGDPTIFGESRQTLYIDYTPATVLAPVPLPAAAPMLAGGLFVFALLRRHRRALHISGA